MNAVNAVIIHRIATFLQKYLHVNKEDEKTSYILDPWNINWFDSS